MTLFYVGVFVGLAFGMAISFIIYLFAEIRRLPKSGKDVRDE